MMGTNYYAQMPGGSVEDDTDRLHIGKKSAGWAFCFNSTSWWDDEEEEEISLRTLEQWRCFLEPISTNIYSFPIKDEYGDAIPYERFLEMVIHSKVAHNRHDHEPWSYTDHGVDFCLREFC